MVLAKTSKSVADFTACLRVTLGVGESADAHEEVERLRYVIYARKSTDTTEKQERSISDQILTCNDLAERAGLLVVDTLHEERSASVSENRPIFRTMLGGFPKKYDAILTWAPDRLARNMKEAGEVIDLLDKSDIQDIKFANGYYFQNDAAGKMMLGIAFVQAKQFSEQHGQNVKRGLLRITGEGKIYGRTKHGYYKDAHQYPRPDGANWELLQRAFKMRLSFDPKLSLKEIGAWLTEQGYPRATKHTPTPKRIIVGERFLSNLFRDPFYAGAHVFGGQVIDLTERFNFRPIITPEEFDMLVKEDGINKKFTLSAVIKPKGSIKANLLRGMVTCAACKRPMSTGITPKQLPEGTKHYFYYRCDAVGCRYKGKSVRAKVIMEAAYAFLDVHPMNPKAGYQNYKQEMTRLYEVRKVELLSRYKSLVQRRKAAEGKLERIKNMLQEHANDKVLVDLYKGDIKETQRSLSSLKKEIIEVEIERNSGPATLQTYEDFIELFGNLAQQIRKIKSMDDMDFIMRKLFSNFTVEGKKVVEITQNSLFRELCLPPFGDGSS